MTNEPPPELPDDWPEAFGEEERDYLYEESRRRLIETIEFGDQQEAKALALVRISLILIAASGIFGDLRVDGGWSWLTVASILAIASSVAVGGIAVWLLHPQDWDTGANVGWLARWSGASKRHLKDESLKGLVEGFGANDEIIAKRGKRLVLLLWAVVFQTLCVVFVQIAAWIGSPA